MVRRKEKNPNGVANGNIRPAGLFAKTHGHDDGVPDVNDHPTQVSYSENAKNFAEGLLQTDQVILHYLSK